MAGFAPEDRLRLLLGEPVPSGGQDSDTFFSDVQIAQLLIEAQNSMRAAAFEGWRMKAAHYADLVTVTEGNALRNMSDLHKHALDMMNHFSKATDGLSFGRTRVGRIRRRN